MTTNLLNRRELIQTTSQSALALLAMGGGMNAWAKDSEGPLPTVGSVLDLPDVTLLDGSIWRAADMQANKGIKALVVYWWASWCPFCAVQSPHMETLWRAQKSNGLGMLALSIDKQESAASGYIKAKGYSFPAGMLTQQVAKMLPKPRGLPVVVVLKISDRKGKVVFAEGGEMFPEDIEGLKKYL
ncbi:MAG: TlpA family protein disulfide reductase [Polaromonas sp.]|nr:TlpA family protein disulfide reductase [Polaromonas sp.]